MVRIRWKPASMFFDNYDIKERYNAFSHNAWVGSVTRFGDDHNFVIDSIFNITPHVFNDVESAKDYIQSYFDDFCERAGLCSQFGVNINDG